MSARTAQESKSSSVSTRHQAAAANGLPSCGGSVDRRTKVSVYAIQEISTIYSGTRRCCTHQTSTPAESCVSVWQYVRESAERILFVRNSLIGFAAGDFCSSALERHWHPPMILKRSCAKTDCLRGSQHRRCRLGAPCKIACSATCFGGTFLGSRAPRSSPFSTSRRVRCVAATRRTYVQTREDDRRREQALFHRLPKAVRPSAIDAAMDNEDWEPVAHWRNTKITTPDCYCFTSEFGELSTESARLVDRSAI